MGTTATLLTVEEFRRLPAPETGKLELLDGEVIHTAPLTMYRHTRTSNRLSKTLMPFEGTAGLGEVFVEAEYKLGERTMMRPDVSVTHGDQLVSDDDLVGAPALAIEVISPSDTAEQMNRKVKLYLENGAIEVWTAYGDTRSVWVFREGRAEEFRGFLRSALLPGLEIDLEQIFS
jgi:Uma2 family endonuclease